MDFKIFVKVLWQCITRVLNWGPAPVGLGEIPGEWVFTALRLQLGGSMDKFSFSSTNLY